MKRRNLRRGLLAFAAVLACMAAPAVARAQSDAEKKQQAKEHYEMANRFYDVGKYGDAIHEYEEAYLLVEDPALLFNIGQAYRLWDRPDDAIRSYKNYLRRRPDASNRADVERKIADLERTLDERRRAVGATPAPASATVIPPPAAVTPPASPPAPAGEALSPAAPPAVEPPPVASGVDVAAAPAEPPAAAHHPKWMAYALLGVGGAGILTSLIAGAVGASKAQKLKTASQNREQFDPAVESNGKAANSVAVASALVGLAAGGVGGYLLWRWRGAASASVSVAPVAEPTYAGASALVTF